MPYLIDSDWIIDQLDELPAATALLNALAGEGIYMSVLTYLEAFQGTLHEEDPESAATKLRTLAASMGDILPISIAVAERCARIRQHLLDQGKRPMRRGFDMLIAATALEYGLTLVTRNVRDYDDIPELRIYRESPSP